ncbi:MAG: cytochrome c3 family protein [Desulfobacterales bacterium]|nr:cytochrome c3 family protein [Desulfobacterales bacterium]MBS3755125.1 cytochrome c3 family protein [Desulfobacterales bacterium]
MNNSRAKNLWLLIIPALLFLAAAVCAQGYITKVEDSGFEKHTRPAVSFAHDAHNEAAGIESCNTCHHMYEDGKLQDQASIGMECSSCHLDGYSGRLELIRVYHLQCKSCHLDQKAGPVQCAQCHRKEE